MNLLRYAAIAMLFVGLCACVKEVIEEPTDDAVIRIASSTISIPTVGAEGAEGGEANPTATSAQSRATTTPTTALKDIVFYFKNVQMIPSDMTVSTLIYGDRTGDRTGAITWTSTDVPTYDKKNNSVESWLVGCWPGKGQGVTVTGDKTQWTIDGKTDILSTTRFPMGSYVAPSSAALPFHHRLAALEVVVKGAYNVSGDALNALWGKISRIELANTATTAAFTAANAGVANSMEGISFSSFDEAIPLLKGATYAEPFEPTDIPAFETAASTEALASGMFAPQAGALTLRIHTTNGAPAVDVVVQIKDASNSNQKFAWGYKHIVTLVLSAPDRKVRVENTTIAPWGVGGEDSGTVTPPLQSRTPDKGFLDWNYTGLVKSGSFDGQTYAIPAFTQSSYNSYTTTINGKLYATFAEALTERPFMVLEVAKADEVAGSNRLTWTESVAACKAKAPAGEWRLPRASELAMMYLNRTELEKTSGFTPFVNTTTSYFSGTEYDHPTRSSWAISFLSGEIESIANNNLRAVRCVRERELELPPVPFVGDYYYTDGTFSTTLDGNKTVNGIIFWVDPTNSSIFKVVSLVSEQGAWATSNDYVVSGARSESDGRANAVAIKAAFDNKYAGTQINEFTFSGAFPASAYCDTYTGRDSKDIAGSWYLPAKNEMQHLYCAYNGVAPQTWATFPAFQGNADAQTKWVDVFNKIGGGITFESINYRSSTESQSEPSKTYYINFIGGESNIYEKSYYALNFRCIQEVDTTPRPKVGDYYYSDGSFSTELEPGKTVEGVVFWSDPANPKHFKIVSMDIPPANWDGNGNLVGNLQWSTELISRGATSASDGKANTLTLMKLTNAAAYPAAKWCYTRNAGLTVPSSGITTSSSAYKWYLPAKDELQHLFCAYWGVAPTTWPAGPSFSAAQGYPNDWRKRFVTTPFVSGSYWSSLEGSGNDSWNVDFGSGDTYGGPKANISRVRCVREITL